MNLVCRQCGETFSHSGARGRTPLYCSAACRQRAKRARDARRFPIEMMGKRWVRAVGKRPVMPCGAAASSTDRSTWSVFEDVQRGAGDGFGVMLGDGLGCYDLDDCFGPGGVLLPWARERVRGIAEPVVFVERSVSGNGLHVFVRAGERRGYRRGGVEFYSRARFIRTTGDRVEVGRYV